MNRKNLEHLLILLITSLLSTVLRYKYGISDQIESLPIVFKFQDNSLFQNDYIIETISREGPRVLYGVVIGFISNILPIEILAFLLTCLSNFVIFYYTYLLLSKYNNNVRAEHAIAIGSLLSLYSFELGASGNLLSDMLLPDTLVKPLIFVCFYYGLEKRYTLATIPLALLSFFHPLMGLVYLCINLFAWFYREYFLDRKSVLQTIHKLLLPVLTVALLAIVFLIVFGAKDHRLKVDDYINILAYFRHPHHYIPSTFYLKDYILFIISGVSIYLLSYKSKTELFDTLSVFARLFLLVISFLCVLGYLFVEVLPNKLIVTLQFFRYLYFIKWLTPLLFLRYLVINDKFNLVSIIYIFSPISILYFIAKDKYVNIPSNANVILSIVIISGSLFLIPFHNLALVGIFYGAICIVYFLNLKITLAYFFCTLCTIVALSIINPKFLSSYLPKFKIEAEINNFAAICNEAKDLGEKNDLYLVPPNGGEFRIIAKKSIVVDFKVFPFVEYAMLEWHNRLRACYGNLNSTGFNAIPEMETNYKQIDDEKLMRIKNVYGIHYAVLYNETKSEFNEVAQNEEYKIVKIDR
jgi:hypothetical protein